VLYGVELCDEGVVGSRVTPVVVGVVVAVVGLPWGASRRAAPTRQRTPRTHPSRFAPPVVCVGVFATALTSIVTWRRGCRVGASG